MIDEKRTTPFCNMHGDHHCFQEVPLHDAVNEIKNLSICVTGLKKSTDKALKLMFGEDMDGGLITRTKLHDKSINRLWWVVGAILSAFLITGTKVWFFSGVG